jgi:hypothetical protein
MNLIWHLIKKDLRALRWWLILWTLACGTHLVLRLIQLKSGDASLPANFAVTGRPDHLALYVLMLLIAPQVVQLDPPVSGRAFWKTLPIARWRLLVGKVLLLLAFFIVLPTVCEIAYFTAAGFGEHTRAAVSIWALRALPPVALVLGASVLSRDLRITAIIVAAAAILLPVGGLNFLVTGWRPEVMRFAIPFSVTEVAVAGISVLVWQYLSAGRFAWLILAAIVGTISVGLWKNKGPSNRTAYPQNYRSEAQGPENVTVPMPAGMTVEVSPLPPSVTTFLRGSREPNWTGTTFHTSVSISGIPEDTVILGASFEQAILRIDSKSIHPKEEMEKFVSPYESEAIAESSSHRQFQVYTGYFALDAEEWKDQPASLTGTLKFTLGRNKRLGPPVPVEAGTLWRSKLDSLTIPKSPSLFAHGYNIVTKTATADIPAAALSSDPPVPEDGRIAFRFVEKSTGKQIRLGTLNVGKTLTFYGSGGYSNSTESGYGRGYGDDPPPPDRTDITRHIREFGSSAGVRNDSLSAFPTRLRKARANARFRDYQAWEIQSFDAATIGVVEVPIRFDNINPPESQWIRAKPSPTEALGETLRGITLAPSRTAAEVDEYLRKLYLATNVPSGARVEHYDNDILMKLYAVGPENLTTLLKWAKLTEPRIPKWAQWAESNGAISDSWLISLDSDGFTSDKSPKWRKYLLRVINDIVRPDDRDLIISSLSLGTDLMPAIKEHSWEKEAAQKISRLAKTGPLPSAWLKLMLTQKPNGANEALVEQCKLGAIAPAEIEALSHRGGFPLKDALNATWITATERNDEPEALIHLFALCLKNGIASVPSDLAVLLSDDGRNRATNAGTEIEDLKNEMSRIMSWRSDCPPTAEAARVWLNKNAANLRFDEATGRYELPKSNP